MSHDLDLHDRELLLARQRVFDLRESSTVWRGRCGVCSVSIEQPPQERHQISRSDPSLADRPKRSRKRLSLAEHPLTRDFGAS